MQNDNNKNPLVNHSFDCNEFKLTLIEEHCIFFCLFHFSISFRSFLHAFYLHAKKVNHKNSDEKCQLSMNLNQTKDQA